MPGASNLKGAAHELLAATAVAARMTGTSGPHLGVRLLECLEADGHGRSRRLSQLLPYLPPARTAPQRVGASSRFSAARSDPSLCICSLLAASCTDSLVAHPPSSPAFLMALSCHSPCPAGACTTCWSCPPAPARACFSGLDADLWWGAHQLAVHGPVHKLVVPLVEDLQCRNLRQAPEDRQRPKSAGATTNPQPNRRNPHLRRYTSTQVHKRWPPSSAGVGIVCAQPLRPPPGPNPRGQPDNPSSPVRGVGADRGGWGWSGGAHTILCRAASFD
jgi:hypothetical protein